jgi:hypothetical protein
LAREDSIYAAILALLAGCYSAQVFTPLRINNDAVILLSVAESAARHGGFLFHGRTTLYPPGYPALLASLLRMGIAHTWVIVAINAVFLFLGMLAARYILTVAFFHEPRHALRVCAVSLLSFVFIIFFTIPLTDFPFFCLAMCCLASMEHVLRMRIDGRFWLWLAGTSILLLGSIATRRVGLALIPAFLWMVIAHPTVKTYLKAMSRRRVLVAIGSLAFVVIFVIGWTATKLNVSLRDFESTIQGHTLAYAVSSIVDFRLRELGQITVNVPFLALPKFAQHMVPWAGALSLTAIVAGLFLKRRTLGPSDAFAIGYLAILSAWPLYDPRLWLPLIPLLISYCALTGAYIAARHRRIPGELVAVYLTVYSVMGLVWLASSTTITFSRSAFLTMYVPRNEFGPTYCAVLGACKDGFDPKAVDQNAAHLLHLYK